MKEKVLFKKLDDRAIMPTYATSSSAGADLSFSEWIAYRRDFCPLVAGWRWQTDRSKSERVALPPPEDPHACF